MVRIPIWFCSDLYILCKTTWRLARVYIHRSDDQHQGWVLNAGDALVASDGNVQLW